MNYQQALVNYMLHAPATSVPAEFDSRLEELDRLGNTLAKMFKNQELSRMWIDKDTHEVHVS
jgi:hypothetical protein